jgi:hypothetical protein
VFTLVKQKLHDTHFEEANLPIAERERERERYGGGAQVNVATIGLFRNYYRRFATRSRVTETT